MELIYYPGCTLKTKANGLEYSAIAALEALGARLKELPRWNCCGTVYSLAQDDLVHQLAPIRNLIRVQEQNADKVVTLCSFCYHTLKRANLLVQQDEEKRKTLNSFMSEEPPYQGQVKVLHLLEVLRDEIGWENIKAKAKLPLNGLKVAPYYGCTLLRPAEVAIDDVERPSILSRLMEAIGAQPVDFPFATECCGSFQIVSNPALVTERAREILCSAVRRGAEALVLTCPLCYFNLTQQQSELKQKYSDFSGIPIVYFSQLLAVSLGVDPQVCRFDSEVILNRLLPSKQSANS